MIDDIKWVAAIAMLDHNISDHMGLTVVEEATLSTRCLIQCIKETNAHNGKAQFHIVIAEQDGQTYTGLNRSTHCNNFIWVYIFTWLFAKEILHNLLHFRHTSLPTHQNNIVNI